MSDTDCDSFATYLVNAWQADPEGRVWKDAQGRFSRASESTQMTTEAKIEETNKNAYGLFAALSRAKRKRSDDDDVDDRDKKRVTPKF